MTVYCPRCGIAAIQHSIVRSSNEGRMRRVVVWRCPSGCTEREIGRWDSVEETARFRYLLPRLYRRSASSACFRPGPAQDKWRALGSVILGLEAAGAPWVKDLRESEARRG